MRRVRKHDTQSGGHLAFSRERFTLSTRVWEWKTWQELPSLSSALLCCTTSASYLAIMAMICWTMQISTISTMNWISVLERNKRTEGSSCCSTSYKCEDLYKWRWIKNCHCFNTVPINWAIFNSMAIIITFHYTKSLTPNFQRKKLSVHVGHNSDIAHHQFTVFLRLSIALQYSKFDKCPKATFI